MDADIREQLWNYFEARREPLWHAFVDCQDAIRKNRDELAQLAGKISASELSQRFHHYLRVDNALLYGHLIAVCSVLEISVKMICAALNPHYGTRQVEHKYRNKRNWLNKHLLYIKENKLILPAPQVLDIEKELNHAITLRNCIGHAWGDIDKHRYPDDVRDSILYLGGNTSNCNYASVSSDGHLVIEDDLVPHVFNQGEELIRVLLTID